MDCTATCGEAIHLDPRPWASLSGDDEHSGHIVGAIAVLDPRFGRLACSTLPALVRQPQQVSEHRLGRFVGHTKRRPRPATSRCASRDTPADDGHAIVGANRRASVAIEPARCGSVTTAGTARASASGLVVVDDDSRAAGEHLDGVREGGGDYRPAAGNGVDENTRRRPDRLSHRAARRLPRTGRRAQRGSSFGSSPSKHTESATPGARACSMRALRGMPHLRPARTFGWVWPAIRYRGRPGSRAGRPLRR